MFAVRSSGAWIQPCPGSGALILLTNDCVAGEPSPCFLYMVDVIPVSYLTLRIYEALIVMEAPELTCL